MTFNPLEQTGVPIAEQFRSWRELNVEPVDIEGGDPYTRCRIVVMNGIEVESIMFSHQFARHTDNPEVKRALALSRRAEQMQQKADNWLLPGSDGPIETTIVYEQVAVDLTAWLARMEPDPYLKQNYDFGLLEDFDHLYRYANLLDLTKGKKAEAITSTVTEIMPGRPTAEEFRHPDDDLRRHYDKHTVDPRSRLHVMTLVAVCWDNAVAESFWESLKRECLQGRVFTTRAEARRVIFRWINWYNTARLHTSLNSVPPLEWEQQYRQAS